MLMNLLSSAVLISIGGLIVMIANMGPREDDDARTGSGTRAVEDRVRVPGGMQNGTVRKRQPEKADSGSEPTHPQAPKQASRKDQGI